MDSKCLDLFGNALALTNLVWDSCGVCGGDETACAGCDFVPWSGKKNDECGVCDGDGSSCKDACAVKYRTGVHNGVKECVADPTSKNPQCMAWTALQDCDTPALADGTPASGCNGYIVANQSCTGACTPPRAPPRPFSRPQERRNSRVCRT